MGCCKSIGPFACTSALLGVAQVGVQWACFFLMYVTPSTIWTSELTLVQHTALSHLPPSSRLPANGATARRRRSTTQQQARPTQQEDCRYSSLCMHSTLHCNFHRQHRDLFEVSTENETLGGHTWYCIDHSYSITISATDIHYMAFTAYR